MNEKKDNESGYYVSRQHFGKDPYFKYQKKLFALEANILRWLGLTTKKIIPESPIIAKKNFFIINRLLSKWCEFDINPFVYAKKVHLCNGYLKFNDIGYVDIQINYDSRPTLVSIPDVPITSKAFVDQNNILKFGISLLENVDQSVLGSILVINIGITCDDNNKDVTYKFPLNVSHRNTFEALYELGTNWIDSYIDLSKFNNKDIRLRMLAYFEKDGKKLFPAAVPCVAWSAPQIVRTKGTKNSRRILVICCEALTDPKFLEKFHDVKIPTPHLDKLSEESLVFRRAYSQNDSTLPSSGTLLTGLYGSQHGIFDYKSNSLMYENPTLSPEIRTLGELLKSHKFATIAGTATTRLGPSYGWCRGFDSFFNVHPPWSDYVPDVAWAKRALESIKGLDGLLFLYNDWLHWPTITFEHTRSPHLYSSDILEEASCEEQTLKLYIERLYQQDKQIGEIISYLKESDQYENTLVMVTGDHGAFLPPWGYHERYAFYERHIRVPLIIKWPNWAKGKIGVIDNPQQASLSIVPTILETLDIEPPRYFQELPQRDSKFKDVTITETLMHPGREDYAISMISDPFKYVMFAKVDWKRYSIEMVEGERLYSIDLNTGCVNESEEVSADNETTVKNFRTLAINFLERNLDFQRELPARNFRTGEIGWEPAKSGVMKRGLSKLKKTIF